MVADGLTAHTRLGSKVRSWPWHCPASSIKKRKAKLARPVDPKNPAFRPPTPPALKLKTQRFRPKRAFGRSR
jgi:hypothetical protein